MDGGGGVGEVGVEWLVTQNYRLHKTKTQPQLHAHDSARATTSAPIHAAHKMVAHGHAGNSAVAGTTPPQTQWLHDAAAESLVFVRKDKTSSRGSSSLQGARSRPQHSHYSHTSTISKVRT